MQSQLILIDRVVKKKKKKLRYSFSIPLGFGDILASVLADDDSVRVDAAGGATVEAAGAGKRQEVGYSERSCYTFDNKRGYCRSVQDCYKLTKLHQRITNLETWILGTRGTCNYVEPTGRQVRPLFSF